MATRRSLRYVVRSLTGLLLLLAGCNTPRLNSAKVEVAPLARVKASELSAAELARVRLVTGDLYWEVDSDQRGHAAASLLVKNDSDRKVTDLGFRMQLYHESELLGEPSDDPWCYLEADILPERVGTATVSVDIPRNLARYEWEVVEPTHKDSHRLTLRAKKHSEFVAVFTLTSATAAVKGKEG